MGRTENEVNANVYNSAGALIDPATEAKQDDILTELGLKANLTDTQPVSAASLPLPAGASTEAKQDDTITEVQKLVGFEIPPHDYIAVTRNANLDIETAIFKTGGAGGTTVATLTLAYDGNNDFLSVTKT